MINIMNVVNIDIETRMLYLVIYLFGRDGRFLTNRQHVVIIIIVLEWEERGGGGGGGLHVSLLISVTNQKVLHYP